MLDRSSYPLNIALARLALTDVQQGSHVRRTRRGPGAFTVRDDECPLEILYGLHDLYIEGFRVKGGGVYLHRDSTYAINHNGKFGFGCEYKELGWDRLGKIDVTLDSLNGALSAMYNYHPGGSKDAIKKAYLHLVVGFAEAIRFDDVVTEILAGEGVTDVDWSKHKDPSKVRVVKS